ncbi:MAG: hypothetical protein AAFX85_05785 [Pseudomonadota bacterium]
MPAKARTTVIGFLLLAFSATALAVGPQKSTERKTGEIEGLQQVDTQTRLQVVIPVFDPGLKGTPKPYSTKDEKWGQVWPEVRRAESKLFAVALKQTIERTNLFSAVRVTPNDQATGDIYVLARILRSNTEDLHLEVQVMDITLDEWIPQTIYKYRIDGNDLTEGARLRGVDPYQPIWDKITRRIVEELATRKERELREIQGVSDMVFAASYADEVYGGYLRERRGRRQLQGLPDDTDPQYARIKNVRAREDLFVDDLQSSYESFASTVRKDYSDFQRQGYPVAFEARKQRQKSNLSKALAGVALVGGVALDTEENDIPLTTIGVAAAGALSYKAFRETREFRALMASLGEIGDSLDLQLAPQNVEFEGRTTQLSGNAAQQFDEIRQFLNQVYAEEATPDREL